MANLQAYCSLPQEYAELVYKKSFYIFPHSRFSRSKADDTLRRLSKQWPVRHIGNTFPDVENELCLWGSTQTAPYGVAIRFVYCGRAISSASASDANQVAVRYPDTTSPTSAPHFPAHFVDRIVAAKPCKQGRVLVIPSRREGSDELEAGLSIPMDPRIRQKSLAVPMIAIRRIIHGFCGFLP